MVPRGPAGIAGSTLSNRPLGGRDLGCTRADWRKVSGSTVESRGRLSRRPDSTPFVSHHLSREGERWLSPLRGATRFEDGESEDPGFIGPESRALLLKSPPVQLAECVYYFGQDAVVVDE